MKKFEKLDATKFQTLERTQMKLAKGGSGFKPNDDTCNKKTHGDLYDIDF